MRKPPLDWLVITAATRAQARGYSAQLRDRWPADSRPCKQCLVLADPGDRRAGSGIATALALARIAHLVGAPPADAVNGKAFRRLRILIVHSGGDSRRLPAFAALGKLFAPLPGRYPEAATDLFDLILDDLLAVALDPKGRTLIASGDVLLGVKRDPPDMNGSGVVGLASPGSPQRAARHGVYVADFAGRVTDFLQKPDLATLRSRNALDRNGSALIDCGLVSLDPRAAGAIVRALLPRRAGTPPIDLYEHVLPALVPRADAREYLASLRAPPDGPLRARCEQTFAALRGQDFSVARFANSLFMHVGTTREYLFETSTNSGGSMAWRSRRRGALSCDGEPRSWLVAQPIIVESCHLTRDWSLGGDNVVVGLPPESSRAINLPRGLGLACVPVAQRDWAVIRFGDEDDFKSTLDNGATFGNRPLRSFVDRRGVAVDDLWRDGEQRSLWTARLWPVGSADASLAATEWMLTPARRPSANWRRLPRFSASELLRLANHRRMIRHRRTLRATEQATTMPYLLGAFGEPVSSLIHRIRGVREAARALAALEAALTHPQWQDSPTHHARCFRAASAILDRFPRAATSFSGLPRRRLKDAAFASIARALHLQTTPRQRPPHLHPGIAFASAPVRIDLAGGWSDTPPICNEQGGTVANVAITLAGRHPIRAWARRLREPVLHIQSLDQGRGLTLTTADEIADHRDPRDWAALAKAASIVCGLSPTRGTLEHWLERAGGGVHLAFESAVPKGSGLGASSILAATIVACLDRLLARRPSVPSIIERVSTIEQMISTAGGWQDQVGGLMPGFKISRTRPGLRQRPRANPIAVPPAAMAAFRERALLYDTGLRRLARNILQGVVWRYLEADPEVERMINQLHIGAEQMALALARGDIASLARGLHDYWHLKKALDPGTSTPEIESLIARVEPYLSGYELPGAGGGGFLFMIARSDADARRVRRILLKSASNPAAGFHDFAVDTRGLFVGDSPGWPANATTVSA
ncbi:MAG: L-fucokinase [Phycisphaerales bacterium]